MTCCAPGARCRTRNQPFVFPESFASTLELPARVEHAEALAFAGQRLFAALSRLAAWPATAAARLQLCN